MKFYTFFNEPESEEEVILMVGVLHENRISFGLKITNLSIFQRHIYLMMLFRESHCAVEWTISVSLLFSTDGNYSKRSNYKQKIRSQIISVAKTKPFKSIIHVT